MYRNELLPDCIAVGMTASEFWNSYPCEVEPYFKAYKKRRLMEDERDYLCGIYTYEAVAIAVSNCFKDKKHKALEYRKKPILHEIEERNRPLSEEEKQRQRELFVEQLKLMQTNFELTHKKDAAG